MMKTVGMVAVLLASSAFLSACTDNQEINAASGALLGAAAGTQVGSGSGRVAATLVGAAVGAQVGANQPTKGNLCTYRNPQTGGTYQAAC